MGSIKPRNLTEEGYGYFGQVIIHVPHGPEGGRGNDKKKIYGVCTQWFVTQMSKINTRLLWIPTGRRLTS